MRNPDTLIRFGALAAIAGGWAWIVKFSVIAARDEGFQPLEGVLYLAGLLGPIGGAVALVALRGRSPVTAAALAALAVLATVVAAAAVQAAVGSVYGGGNLGGEQEAGILALGLVWVLIGVALRSRRPLSARGAG